MRRLFVIILQVSTMFTIAFSIIEMLTANHWLFYETPVQLTLISIKTYGIQFFGAILFLVLPAANFPRMFLCYLKAGGR